MASPAPSMPHLSPRPSAEASPTLGLEQKRHKSKRPSFLFGKKDQPDIKSPGPTSEVVEDLEDAPRTSMERDGSHGPGPELRLLPQEAEHSGLAETSAKADRYVELPREPENAENTLHAVKENKVKYEWDYVMEHQRGFRFLSTPLFSQAGLLPSDPPPFATVSADPVPCSLEEYQLPSPEWRWAGQGWCVDMRGDGEVQEDGFEYNWWFRRKGWRPQIGPLSSGAYVRRRRWMRLRYLTPPEPTPMPEEAAKPPASPRKSNALEGWEKLHAKMKETDLDRERLDSVKSWLDETSANEDLLRQHWSETLNMFVFPSSRDLLRSMVKSMGWEVLPQGEDEFFWKDRSRARR